MITGEKRVTQALSPTKWIEVVSNDPDSHTMKDWVRAITRETSWKDVEVSDDYKAEKCVDSEEQHFPLDHVLGTMLQKDRGVDANDPANKDTHTCRIFLDAPFLGPHTLSDCQALSGLITKAANNKGKYCQEVIVHNLAASHSGCAMVKELLICMLGCRFTRLEV